MMMHVIATFVLGVAFLWLPIWASGVVAFLYAYRYNGVVAVVLAGFVDWYVVATVPILTFVVAACVLAQPFVTRWIMFYTT